MTILYSFWAVDMLNRLFCRKSPELAAVISIVVEKIILNIRQELAGRANAAPNDISSDIFYKNYGSTLVYEIGLRDINNQDSTIGTRVLNTDDIEAITTILRNRSSMVAAIKMTKRFLMVLFLGFLLGASLYKWGDENDNEAKNQFIDAFLVSVSPVIILKFYQHLRYYIEKNYLDVSFQQIELTPEEIFQYCALKAKEKFSELKKIKNLKEPNEKIAELDALLASCDFGTIPAVRAKEIMYDYLGLLFVPEYKEFQNSVLSRSSRSNSLV